METQNDPTNIEQKDPVTGRFLPRNDLWKQRLRSGIDSDFDAETLTNKIAEYFDFCENNPLMEGKVNFYEGAATITSLPKMRAMTIEGLCNRLGIVSRTWRKWKDERPDLIPIIEYAEQIIYEQKLTGAAAGLLNANIIARELGLADTKAHQNLDKYGQKADAPSVSIFEEDAYKEILLAIKQQQRGEEEDNDE